MNLLFVNCNVDYFIAAVFEHTSAESQCEAENIFPVLTKRPVYYIQIHRIEINYVIDAKQNIWCLDPIKDPEKIAVKVLFLDYYARRKLLEKPLIFFLEQLNFMNDVRLNKLGREVSEQTLKIPVQLQRAVLGEHNVAYHLVHNLAPREPPPTPQDSGNLRRRRLRRQYAALIGGKLKQYLRVDQKKV
jgi:hypothetical protein